MGATDGEADWGQLHLRMPPDVMRRARLLAASRGKKLAWIIRPAMVEFIDREFDRAGLADLRPSASRGRKARAAE